MNCENQEGRVLNLASLFFVGTLLVAISLFGMNRLAEFRDDGNRAGEAVQGSHDAASVAFATPAGNDEIYFRQFAGDFLLSE